MMNHIWRNAFRRISGAGALNGIPSFFISGFDLAGLVRSESVPLWEENLMLKAKSALPEKTRIQVARLLQARLADALDLMIQAKQAHWNVKGAGIFALHELFDELSADWAEYVDLIAGRIIQLGSIAEGNIRLAAKKSNLPEYPLSVSSGKEHVVALSHALAVFGELTRNSFHQANELSDADTADILAGISRGADKYLWLVQAHAQADN
jgi:starvation-inducible DNA-binding protein